MKSISTRAHKGKKKIFLKPEVIQEIVMMKQQKIKTKVIALKYGISNRHVLDIARNNKPGINKEFTPEEESLIIDLYVNQHIQKEAQIAKYLPTKKAYMIRNKIRLLKKEGRLEPSHFLITIEDEAPFDPCFSDFHYDRFHDGDPDYDSNDGPNFWDD